MTAIGSAPPVDGAAPRVPGLRFVAWVAAGAVLFGLLAGQLVATGKAGAVAGLVVVVVPVVLSRRPYLTPAFLLGAALTIEQFPDSYGPSGETITAKIPLFHGMGSLHMSPIDVVLLSLVMFALVRARDGQVLKRLRVPTTAALLGLIGAVGLGLVSGLMHGGDMRVMFMELRPFTYLTAAYLIAMMFLTNRAAVHALLWVIVGAAAIKSSQGIMLFFQVRHMVPRPEAVLGHEEALFFGIFVFMTAAMWLYEVRGRLRTAATCIVPLVIVADLANSRRAAWLVLGGGLLVLGIVAAKALPHRRLMLTRAAAVICVVLAVYMPAFWNKSGGLAQPARAVRSAIAPSERDASSDLYRIQEDENLKVNIQEGGMLGRGFGVRIDYPLPIADISDMDPLIDYIPHNGVLYILMRMGAVGGIAVWTLIGVAIIGAIRLARSPDRGVAFIGAGIASGLVAYSMEAEIDQGFFFYRIAIVIGTLYGLSEAARRLQRRPPETGVAA
jgi:hypothetical protein